MFSPFTISQEARREVPGNHFADQRFCQSAAEQLFQGMRKDGVKQGGDTLFHKLSQIFQTLRKLSIKQRKGLYASSSLPTHNYLQIQQKLKNPITRRVEDDQRWWE